VGKHFGRRPAGRPKRRCEVNTKFDNREMNGNDGKWMEQAQDRVSIRALVLRDMEFWGGVYYQRVN